MARYDAITEYLREDGAEKRTLSFSQIERLIGAALPPSARGYAAWWANDARPGRQSHAWLATGWKTEDVDLADECVTFKKVGAPPSKSSASKSRQKRPPDVPIDLPEVPDGRVQLAAEMCWRALGVVQSASGSLEFPSAPATAGLYRLRLLGPHRNRQYIGESVNVRRRFSNYRSPGPTQMTSRRINHLLLEHLGAGGTIAVDVILADVTLAIGGQGRQVDLTDKPTRRLLEQAAIVACGATDVESMNL